MDDTFLTPVVALWAFVAGFLVAIFAFFIVYANDVKRNVRRRIEADRYDSEAINWMADTRIETRTPVENTPVLVKAPKLDTAGVVMPGEEQEFTAVLTDISLHGATVISPYFLSEGLVIFIACYEKNTNFSLREAMVRNIRLVSSGIRVGLQFIIPLEDINL
jgi:hypothetical protein